MPELLAGHLGRLQIGSPAGPYMSVMEVVAVPVMGYGAPNRQRLLLQGKLRAHSPGQLAPGLAEPASLASDDASVARRPALPSQRLAPGLAGPASLASGDAPAAHRPALPSQRLRVPIGLREDHVALIEHDGNGTMI